ncbi:MAG: cytidylate kinase-like family protein [Pseudobutyrivibrio sp.]|nr:cytidylate kinase-like family protein [Pseudobutyrivibrio sp.]
MAQFIIALGREYGSGGHEIATKLSERLGIPLYDRNMLDQMAEKNGINSENLHQFDEKSRLHGLTRTVRGHSSSAQDHVAQIQFDFIRGKAEEGESFIIVGRCGEQVLKGYKGLVTIFVRGDEDVKAERICRLYHLSDKEARMKMHNHDKKRKAYHNSHSQIKWGDSRAYDLLVNSSKLGIDATTDFIESYVRECIARNED